MRRTFSVSFVRKWQYRNELTERSFLATIFWFDIRTQYKKKMHTGFSLNYSRCVVCYRLILWMQGPFSSSYLFRVFSLSLSVSLSATLSLFESKIDSTDCSETRTEREILQVFKSRVRMWNSGRMRSVDFGLFVDSILTETCYVSNSHWWPGILLFQSDLISLQII